MLSVKPKIRQVFVLLAIQIPSPMRAWLVYSHASWCRKIVVRLKVSLPSTHLLHTLLELCLDGLNFIRQRVDGTIVHLDRWIDVAGCLDLDEQPVLQWVGYLVGSKGNCRVLMQLHHQRVANCVILTLNLKRCSIGYFCVGYVGDPAVRRIRVALCEQRMTAGNVLQAARSLQQTSSACCAAWLEQSQWSTLQQPCTRGTKSFGGRSHFFCPSGTTNLSNASGWFMPAQVPHLADLPML